jgi:hypothetical protein
VGLIDTIRGNASETDAEKIEEQLESVLVDGERIERAFKLIRDFVAFTDRRLILVNKQGVTGRKVEYHSIPYRSITHFSVETAGTFDGDSELKIWISGQSAPVKRELARGANVIGVQKTLALHVTR